MSRFDDCYKIIRKLEGGYANEVHDSGGPTMGGVTQETYDNWRESGGQSVQPVKFITEDEIREIYSDYWRDCKASYCLPPLDLLVADCAINSGPRRAIKLLQNCLGVGSDGIFGPQTHGALHEEIIAMGIKHVCEMYLQERQYWYMEIVRRNASQRKFIRGWLARLEHLREYV